MTADGVDLNLLRVLDALLEEGSVAKAATRLHLSAPAVSRSLGRLRRATGDPLFVRTGRGLTATPHALELRADAKRALELAGAVLSPSALSFDPSSLQRDVSISAGDALIAAIGMPLVAQLAIDAPGVNVAFLPDVNEVELLKSGDADLDVGTVQGHGPEVTSELLFVDRFVAAVRAGHPLAGKTLTRRRFAAAHHIVVSARGHRTQLRGGLAEAARTTIAPSFVVAASMVADSDAVAVLPNQVVTAFADRFAIVGLELPERSAELPIVQSWHRRNDNDPAHRWLRGAVKAQAALTAPAEISRTRTR